MTIWKDYPDTSTPITAAALNSIESRLDEAATTAAAAQTRGDEALAVAQAARETADTLNASIKWGAIAPTEGASWQLSPGEQVNFEITPGVYLPLDNGIFLVTPRYRPNTAPNRLPRLAVAVAPYGPERVEVCITNVSPDLSYNVRDLTLQWLWIGQEGEELDPIKPPPPPSEEPGSTTVV